MATITRENIAPLNDKLVVTISKEDYLPEFEKSLKRYAKTATIPGFRKGMVPAGVIKKMHGQGIFNEQVFSAVDKSVNNYIKENKLEIIGQPLPLENEGYTFDVNTPQDYVFNFEIGLQPEINIDLADITITRYNIEVSKDTLDKEVERVQSKAGNYTNPETVEAQDAVLNVETTVSDKDGNIAEDAQKGNSSLTLNDFSAKAAKSVKGKKVDDTVVLNLADAFASEDILKRIYHDLGLSTEKQKPDETYISLKISKIGLLEKAPLNEKLFKEIFPDKDIKTEEDFREELKKDVEIYYAGSTQAQLHDQIYHALVDDTKLEFPEAFLKRLLKATEEKVISDEEAEKQYPGFIKQLQWALISSKLSVDNNIQVTPDEIKAFAKNQLLQYLGGQISADANADWVNDYAERMLNDRKFIDDAHGQIRINKLFQALETQVKAKDESISENAFEEKVKHHHH